MTEYIITKALNNKIKTLTLSLFAFNILNAADTSVSTSSELVSALSDSSIDTIYLTDDISQLNAYFSANGSKIIDGSNIYTILNTSTGGSSGSVITIKSGDSLTLQNLSVTNAFKGSNPLGVLLESSSTTLNLYNVNFYDMQAGTSAEEAGGGYYGIALRIKAGEVGVISDSSFSSNGIQLTAGYNQTGGAISVYSSGSVGSIENTSFSYNYIEGITTTAGKYFMGGAIYNSTTIDSISEGSVFSSNYVSSLAGYTFGGAIANYNTASIGIISDSSFIGNSANIITSYTYWDGSVVEYDSETGIAYGGAISNYYSTIYTIDNVIFSENSVNAQATNSVAYGGAISNYYYKGIGTISNSTFSGNYAEATSGSANGGAISNYYGATIESISNTSFSDNYAKTETGTARGGAIYNAYSASISLSNVSFTDNYATSTSGKAYGGAIYNSSTINISDSTFNNNSALTLGGAIYNTGTLSYTLSEDTAISFSGNQAGGAGGFLYNTNTATFDIGTDAILTIGAYDSSFGSEDSTYASTDSIYNSGSFTKSGSGTLLLHSSFTNTGTIAINEGVMIIGGDVEAVSTDDDSDIYWFDEVLSYLGEKLYDSYSVLMIGSPLSVGEGLSLGTYTADSTNIASFASDSILAINIDATNGMQEYSAGVSQAALIGDGSTSLDVKEGAVLLLYGISETGDVRIAEGFSDSSSMDMWDIQSVASVNPLYQAENIKYETEIDETGSIYLTIDYNPDAIESLSVVADIVGVSSAIGRLVHLAKDTTMARFSSFDESFNATSFCDCSYSLDTNDFYCSENCDYCGTKKETNWGVWAIPMYTYSEARGLNVGSKSTGYDMYFGGANLGVDYTLNDSYRAGVALHGGYGESNSVDSYFEQTNNDFQFYSLTLYNGYKKDNLLVYADVNFAFSQNEIEQYYSYGNLYADVDAYALSASLRLEYIIERDGYNIIPHAGFEYIYLAIQSYDIKQYSESILNIDCDAQHIYNIPLGITITTDFLLSNEWTLSPFADLGITFSLGDLYSGSTAYFSDITPTNSSVQSYNNYNFTGLLGFELQKDNTRVGLSYFVEASENITSHNFRLNYRYSF